jgi:hypothetical protein
MRRSEFDGRLLVSDLPEPTAEQGEDFLLNLRIVQQTQKRLFESLVLLCLLDLVFSFGSVLHRTIMPRGSSAKRPSTVLREKAAQANTGLAHLFRPSSRKILNVDVKNPSEWQFVHLCSFSVGLFFSHCRIPAQCGWRSDLGARSNL